MPETGRDIGMAAHRDTQDATPLRMVRAEVDVRGFQRWMGSRRFRSTDHAMHSLLTECFGDLAPKPFRLIEPRSGSTAVLYGYGRADTDSLREQADICSDPLQARLLPSEGIDSKAMPPAWTVGRRLGFEVRIRPVVRRSGRSGERPGSERDAFLTEGIEGREADERPSRERVYAEWLSREFDRRTGARVEVGRSRLISFRRSRAVYKPDGRGSEGPDAVMRGVLAVTESEAFGALLARGIGRHRAYGYGMLLLRPAGR